MAKTLSALALTLMFGNVSHAGIISYQYSFSDSSNTVTANFSIDDTKGDNNMISGTFTWNGTTYTADPSRTGDGYTDTSFYGPEYSGYKIGLYTSVNESPDYGLIVDSNSYDFGKNVINQIVFEQNGRRRITLTGVGTLTVVPTVSAVPVPAAAWLFGSSLVGLRRRQQQA